MKRRRPSSHVVVHPSHQRPPRLRLVFFLVVIAADNDVEEDFMNPTLMAPHAIRLRYTPAEVRIFFHLN
jgi:hypothetical protein